MSQEFIEIGTGEQTGDGESIRSAFIKINNNFSDIYNIVTTEGNRAFVGESLPPGAVDGNFWLNKNNGRLYINVDSQWIAPVIPAVPNQFDEGIAGKVLVSSEPPGDTTEGSIWFDNDTGSLYVKVGDQWVQPFTGGSQLLATPYDNTQTIAWNIPEPTTMQEAIDRIARFIYTKFDERM